VAVVVLSVQQLKVLLKLNHVSLLKKENAPVVTVAATCMLLSKRGDCISLL
jgi:hypothetical protein